MSKLIFSVDIDWTKGSDPGLAGLVQLCEDYDMAGTFFTVSGFARQHPDLVHELSVRGHEVGLHGLEHGYREYENYRVASESIQYSWLEAAKTELESSAQVSVLSFRAPNLWVSNTTLQLLEVLGFTHDSSVPSRRLDLGYGRLGFDASHFFAPPNPYHPSRDRITRKGRMKILEVPPTTLMLPFNMSALRVFGLNPYRALVRLAAATREYLVFYCHPEEFVKMERKPKRDEPRRYQIGLGPHNFDLLRRFLDDVLTITDGSRRLCDVPSPLGQNIK